MNKLILTARLRAMSDFNFLDVGKELINTFGEYFADWLENTWPKEEITASNYFELIGQVIARLRQENMDDHPTNKDLRLLIHTIKGVNTMEQQIRDYFILEEVVKFLTVNGFYHELVDFLMENK